LGLPLVRSLAEMHGGRAEARSDGPGNGSEFIVRLPLLAEDRRKTPVRRTGPVRTPTARMPAAGLHILVVEDNEDGRESLRELLEIWGHEVSVAGNGPEGVEMAFSIRPEVALVDIGLPGLDGNEVARRIRSLLGGDEISLIAMTGYGQPEDRRRALQAGFDRYLVKPVDPAVLSQLLSEARPGRNTPRQASIA
jgi:CheY-like chemotaxis protein